MVQPGSNSIDRWGVDPLAFEMFDDLERAGATEAQIDAGLEHNPQLLSFYKYHTIEYWPNILAANALCHPSEMKAGMRLLIPVKRTAITRKKIKRTVL